MCSASFHCARSTPPSSHLSWAAPLVYMHADFVLLFLLLKANDISAAGLAPPALRQKQLNKRNSLQPPPPPERRSSAVSASPILPSKVKRDSGIFLTDPESFPAPPPSLMLDLPPPPPADLCEPPPDFVPPPPPPSISSSNADLPPPPPPPPVSNKPPTLTKKPVPLPPKRQGNALQDGEPRAAGPPPIGGGGRQADFMSDLMKALEKKRGSSSWTVRTGGL